MTVMARAVANGVDPLTLPRNADGHGYLYVLQFSTGLLKVGCTRNPYTRMSNYRTTLTPFDITINECWVSRPHPGYLATELDLIAAASEMASDSRQSEYFLGVDFGRLVSAFESQHPDLKPEPPAVEVKPPHGDLLAAIREIHLIELRRDAVMAAHRRRYQDRRDGRRAAA
jgi:hypothetical protein